MEEKKIKKKLTLTVSTKKPYNFTQQTQGKQKKSFIIEKTISRKRNERRFYDRNSTQNKSTAKFIDIAGFNSGSRKGEGLKINFFLTSEM